MIVYANPSTGLTQSSGAQSFWAENNEAIKLLEKIQKREVECSFCKELAVGLNLSGQPVCDIPGNHPEEDSAVA